MRFSKLCVCVFVAVCVRACWFLPLFFVGLAPFLLSSRLVFVISPRTDLFCCCECICCLLVVLV